MRLRTASLLALVVSTTACAHPLDAVMGDYQATLTLTLAGGSAAHRTHELTGTVVPQTDDGVAGTVTIELTKTIDTTTTTCTLVLVGGTTETAPVEFSALSCRFPGEKLAKVSTFVSSTMKSAAAANPPDFSGGFDVTLDGLYTYYDTLLFNEVRIVNDATVKLTVSRVE